MVLNKKEKILMDVIVKSKMNKKGQVLMTPLQMLEKIPYSIEFREDELEPVLTGLVYDNYFTIDTAKRKGDTMYIITLKENGLGYIRQKKVERKKLIIRVAIASAIAIFTFFLRRILGLFF